MGYPVMLKHGNIAEAIDAEAARQIELRKSGRFPFTTANNAPESLKLAILVEEVGEVAFALNEAVIAAASSPDTELAHIQQRYGQDAIKELTQCAATCVNWIASLQERAPYGFSAP